MFENIKQCIREYEDILSNFRGFDYEPTKEELNIIEYFTLHLAQAIMTDLEYDNSDEKLAKIILAAKGLSNEVTIKVE